MRRFEIRTAADKLLSRLHTSRLLKCILRILSLTLYLFNNLSLYINSVSIRNTIKKYEMIENNAESVRYTVLKICKNDNFSIVTKRSYLLNNV
jgi:hypothetical protein